VRVLRTCRQIRDEGQLVLYQDNSWALHTAALIIDRQVAVLLYNKHLFDMSTRHPYISFIRTIDFAISLAPYAHRHLSGAEVMTYRGTSLWERVMQLRSRSDIYFSVFEAQECERMELVLKHLAFVQRRAFPHLQTIMISLAFHFEGDADRLTCDRELTMQIKLHSLEQRSSPVPSQHHWPFEPRRRILTPLASLDNVQSVVVRRQLVPTQAPASGSGTQTAAAGSNMDHSRLVWTFPSISSMLFSAGYKFENFNTREAAIFQDERVRQVVHPFGLGVWTGA
jgi:hypothetical protein